MTVVKPKRKPNYPANSNFRGKQKKQFELAGLLLNLRCPVNIKHGIEVHSQPQVILVHFEELKDFWTSLTSPIFALSKTVKTLDKSIS